MRDKASDRLSQQELWVFQPSGDRGRAAPGVGEGWMGGGNGRLTGLSRRDTPPEAAPLRRGVARGWLGRSRRRRLLRHGRVAPPAGVSGWPRWGTAFGGGALLGRGSRAGAGAPFAPSRGGATRRRRPGRARTPLGVRPRNRPSSAGAACRAGATASRPGGVRPDPLSRVRGRAWVGARPRAVRPAAPAPRGPRWSFHPPQTGVSPRRTRGAKGRAARAIAPRAGQSRLERCFSGR